MSTGYYYQASASERTPLAAVSLDDSDDAHVAFDRVAGFHYLCLLPSLIAPCFMPLFALGARKHMDSQRCKITDRRVEFEAGWLDRSHKSIPLDRIQDVNVRQDCVLACFGIHTLEIQTAGAGGGMRPEATLIAPVDAMIVRDIIMDRRDALVLGHKNDTLPSLAPAQYGTQSRRGEPSNAAIVDELRSIKDTLARLEAQVQIGVDHVQKQV